MSEQTIECIQSELDLAMWLLIIGFNNVSDSPNTKEAVIMRTARYLLENLHRYVGKLNKE